MGETCGFRATRPPPHVQISRRPVEGCLDVLADGGVALRRAGAREGLPDPDVFDMGAGEGPGRGGADLR